MKVRSLLWSTLCVLAMSVTFASCDDDNEEKWPDEGSLIELPQRRAFILNEGVYNSNNAGIAFYAPNKDAKDPNNNFIPNIYFKQNNKQLGDTGQDMIEYEDKIYVILSGSKLLVRLNAAGVEEARLSFTAEDGDPRYMTAHNGKIYVTIYSGRVARIDANTLKIEEYADVNSNPEQIVELEGKLYVANSGWGMGNTVSVIDIASFTKEKDIEVAANPNSLRKANNEIYLLSWAVSWMEPQTPYSLQRIKNDGTVESIAVATHLASNGNIIYLANSVETNWETHESQNQFFSYNAKTHTLSNATFLKDMPAALGNTSLRGINVDDKTGDIYIYAYGTGVTNGDVYRFKADGTFVESFDCGGVFPAKIIFL